jgi:hypothetical protein
MDRGYDSETIHRQICEDLHTDSIIPIRSWNSEVVGVTYRQEMALHFDDAKFRRRQLVENKFSVMKRKFGGDLKARKFVIQLKEIAGKMIVCNIHRFLQFLVIEVFYSASISKKVYFQLFLLINQIKIKRYIVFDSDYLLQREIYETIWGTHWIINNIISVQWMCRNKYLGRKWWNPTNFYVHRSNNP